MLSGQRIDGFKIERLVSAPGKRASYLARAEADGRQVFLQLLETRETGTGRLAAHLRRLAATLALLDHPNLVRVVAAGDFEAKPFYVTEFVEGQLLNHALRPPFSWREVCNAGRQLSEALAHLHRHRFVHGDVKPSRIPATSDGTLKLIYPDVERMILSLDHLLGPTQFRNLGGRNLTHEYAAPEQMTGATVTPQSDLYALGVVVYELLCGQHPFPLVSQGKPLTVYRRRLASPKRLAIEIPTELDALVQAPTTPFPNGSGCE